MTVDYCIDGKVTDRLIGCYEERAKGGFGGIIVEAAMIDERVRFNKYAAALWDDSMIEDQARLVKAIKKHDCAAILQLNHNGRQLGVAPGEEEKNVGPSAVPCTLINVIPHVLTVDEIHEIVEMFAEGALRGKKAGYDAVEIHGAHGYLLCEFMSPYSNKRVDEYGGSIDNRMRFPLEVVRAIKEKCGEDYPLLFRLSADEYVEGGLQIAETQIMARMLEDAGVDCIDVSSSNYATLVHYEPSMYVKFNSNEELGAAIKQVVSIPVSLVGHITDPRLGESLVMSGKADIVAIGRASIADPHLVNKYFEGHPEDIRQCLSCNQGCVARCNAGLPISCMTNPSFGYEYLNETAPADVKKKVVVVGGGVAGILAAEGAALKGHQVTLYERDSELGGVFLTAAVPPSKGQLTNLLSWHIAEIKKLGVEIILNTEFTKEMYENCGADKVIIATGTNQAMPPIPGITGRNVVQAVDVLKSKVRPAKKVIIAGGGLVGCETALYLADYHHDVTIVEMKDIVAADDEPTTTRVSLMEALKRKEVGIMTNTKILSMSEDSVTVSKDGEEITLPCDSIVLAMGTKSERTLFEELKANDNVTIIGTEVAPATALIALREGFEAGINA